MASRISVVAMAAALCWFAAGCGSSTPTESGLNDLANVNGDIVLNANVRVSQNRVGPGESVELSATVDAVRAEALRFSWVNVTGHGELVGEQSGSVTGPFNIRWEGPPTVDAGALNVEVIHLVITAISQVIAVSDSGVQSSYDIATTTKTIPITILSSPQ